MSIDREAIDRKAPLKEMPLGGKSIGGKNRCPGKFIGARTGAMGNSLAARTGAMGKSLTARSTLLGKIIDRRSASPGRFINQEEEMRDPLADYPVEVKQVHFDQLNNYKESLRQKPELKSLFLEMTISCNEHCLHCGSRCGDVRQEAPLTDEEILKTLQILKLRMQRDKQPLPFLNITGGEPMLRPHLISLMKKIHFMGYSWGMTSNGLLIDQKAAEELKAAGLYSISISVDGMRESHEWFRQTKGSWDRALAAVDHLIAAGIESVMITTVANKRNIGQLDEVLAVVKDHHCRLWRLINMEPIGRALTNPDLMLDTADYRYLYRYLADHQDDPDLQVITTCNHYVGLDLERKIRPWYFFCRAGLNIAAIQYNGDISSCLDIERRPELVFGNIRKDDLYKVWQGGFGIYRTHKEEESRICKDCPHKDNCQGGGWHTWDFDRKEPRICMMKELGYLS